MVEEWNYYVYCIIHEGIGSSILMIDNWNLYVLMMDDNYYILCQGLRTSVTSYV